MGWRTGLRAPSAMGKSRWKTIARRLVQACRGVRIGDRDTAWVQALEPRMLLSVVVPAGPELPANAPRGTNQYDPAIATDDAGNHVVVWASLDQDGSYDGIFARRVNARGVAQGDEFRVNTFTWDYQTDPTVAMDADGDFVVAWYSSGQGGIYAQRYSASGKQGEEFLVGGGMNPAAAMSDEGSFVVVYASYGRDRGGYGIYGQRFNAAGIAQGGEFLVNTTTAGDQKSPTVAMDADGDFVVAWQSALTGGGTGAFARRYDRAGQALGGEFRVDEGGSTSDLLPAAATDPAGNFTLAWQRGSQIYARRYSVGGIAQGGEFRVGATSGAQAQPSIAVGADGSQVVSWIESYQAYAQVYDAAGNAVGGAFRVHAASAANYSSAPVAMDSIGGFVVAWEAQDDPNSSARGVFARRHVVLDHPASIGGRVWNDLNADGIQQGTEPGRDGVTVRLCSADGWLADTTTTAAGGSYRFSKLRPGENYFLEFVPPSGMISTRLDVGTNDGLDSDADPSNGRTALFSLGPDAVDLTRDAGLTVPASISGVAFLDLNQNGLRDSGEEGLSGWFVYLDANDNGERDADERTILTDSKGAYTIGGLLPGAYRVGADMQSQWSMTTPAASLVLNMTIGLERTGVDIGLWTAVPMYPMNSVGSTFRVNSFTNGNQASPVAASDGKGRYVVAWSSNAQDGSGQGVYAQRLDSQGLPAGAEFRVNTATAGDQTAPDIAMNAAGRFVVVWQSPDSTTIDIFARIYAANGVATCPEFRVNTTLAGSQIDPSVAIDSTGNFVVVWSGPGAAGEGIYYQRFDAAGNAQGLETRAENQASPDAPSYPDVAMAPGGTFVLTWASRPGTVAGEIFAQRFSAAGAAEGPLTQVNTMAGLVENRPSIGMGGDGQYVIAWEGGTPPVIGIQRFRADGVREGGESKLYVTPVALFSLPVGGYRPGVSVLSDGGYVVTWESNTVNQDVWAQRYNSAGLEQRPARILNSTYSSTLKYGVVAPGPGGDFLAVWQDNDGGGYGIYAQRYVQNTHPATIGGVVWNDGNGNGMRESDETFSKDVQVSLYDEAGVRIAWEWTDQQGAYRFDDLMPNRPYYVQVAAPTDAVFAPQDQGGNDLLDSDVAPLTGRMAWKTPQPDEVDLSWSAGLNAPARIRGKMFHDLNRNGQDWNEPGVAGWTVYLDFDSDGQLDPDERTAVTDDTGSFTFANLPGGTYRVAALPQERWVLTKAYNVVSIAVGADIGGNLLGGYTLVGTAPAGPVGPEVVVNSHRSTTFKGQPAVSADAQGNYVVVWVSPNQDGWGDGVYAQRFSAAGAPLGQEFRVATNTQYEQTTPAVAMDADGDFVVVWEDTRLNDIQAQRFNAAGVPQGQEFTVNTYKTSRQHSPAVAMESNGDFVVTWVSFAQDGEEGGIYAQRFNASGALLGSEFRVNTWTRLDQNAPVVAMDRDGDFVIVWTSEEQDSWSEGIYAQRYNTLGQSQGSEFRVNFTTRVRQIEPSVGMDGDGNFVVAWSSAGQDGDEYGVYAQRYAVSGAPQGGEFRVNTSTLLSQQSSAVAMGSTGEFMIAWSGAGRETGTGVGTYARRYNLAGLPQGGEFRVNTTAQTALSNPAVAMSGSNAVVAWQAGEIRSQRYQPISSPAAVGGVVWDDSNGNGVQDGGEPKRDGVAVTLYTETGAFVAMVKTAGGGQFRFDNLRPGLEHYLKFDLPSGLIFARGDQGNDATDSDVIDSTGLTRNFVLAANQTDLTQGAGMMTPASISGVKYHDADADGVRDAEETPLGAWTVFIDSNGNGNLDAGEQSTTTDSYGVYRFNNLVPGAYQVAEVTQKHWTRTTPSSSLLVTLAAGQSASGVQIGGSTDVPITFAAPTLAEHRVTGDWKNENGISDVASDQDGNYVVVWATGDTNGIRAMRYDRFGTAQGPELVVHQRDGSFAGSPRIAMDVDGDWVVVWNSHLDGGLFGIYARRYSKVGVPLGDAFLVNTTTENSQANPAVAVDGDGDFIITWRSQGQDGSGYGVYAQQYSAAGVPQGGEFRVNTFTTGDQRNAEVAMDAAGNFVVAWHSVGQDGSAEGVFAQRFNANGTPVGAEFRVNSYTNARQYYPAVDMDADGDFVIAWMSNSQDGGGEGIYAQRYDAQGVPQGGEFRVNTTYVGNQEYPDVAMDAAGNFAIAWASGDVMVQRYNAAGLAEGGEMRLNSFAVNEQRDVSLAMDQSGDFAAVWLSKQHDQLGSGIFAQRYRQFTQVASVGGTVWDDTVVDGSRNATESRRNGVVVNLLNDAGAVVRSTTTASGGVYRFDGVPAGWGLRLAVIAPSGTAFTYRDRGTDDAIDSDVDPLSGRTELFALMANEVNLNFDAGLTSPVSVMGVKFNDLDGDAFRDSGEKSLAGWTIFVDADGDGQLDAGEPRAVTDASGGFTIGMLSPGVHRLAAVAQDRWTMTTPASQLTVTLYPGQGPRYVEIGSHTDVADLAAAPAGPEAPAHASLGLRQVSPQLATSASGDYVMTWTLHDGNGSSQGVYAQRYAADGTATGSAFRVDPDQYNPSGSSIAMALTGEFVIVWQQGQYDTAIYAQRFDAQGHKLGAAFQVVDAYKQQLPVVAMDAQGGFVVAWESAVGGYDVYARRYDRSGQAVGSEFRVNTFTNGEQRLPEMGMDAAGNFAIAWTGVGAEGTGIHMQRFDAQGSKQGGETMVSSGIEHSLAMSAAGDLVIAYSIPQYGSAGLTGSTVYAQRYNAAGVRQGAAIVASPASGIHWRPVVSMDASSDFVVSWGWESATRTVLAQRFNAAGLVQGNVIQVSASPEVDARWQIASAMDADGDFVVAWGVWGGNNNLEDILVRRYRHLPTRFQGGPGADAWRIRMNPSGDAVDVFLNAQSTTPAYSLPLSQLPSLSMMPVGGDDTLTIDMSGGNPIPGGASCSRAAMGPTGS